MSAAEKLRRVKEEVKNGDSDRVDAVEKGDSNLESNASSMPTSSSSASLKIDGVTVAAAAVAEASLCRGRATYRLPLVGKDAMEMEDMVPGLHPAHGDASSDFFYIEIDPENSVLSGVLPEMQQLYLRLTHLNQELRQRAGKLLRLRQRASSTGADLCEPPVEQLVGWRVPAQAARRVHWLPHREPLYASATGQKRDGGHPPAHSPLPGEESEWSDAVTVQTTPSMTPQSSPSLQPAVPPSLLFSKDGKGEGEGGMPAVLQQQSHLLYATTRNRQRVHALSQPINSSTSSASATPMIESQWATDTAEAPLLELPVSTAESHPPRANDSFVSATEGGVEFHPNRGGKASRRSAKKSRYAARRRNQNSSNNSNNDNSSGAGEVATALPTLSPHVKQPSVDAGTVGSEGGDEEDGGTPMDLTMTALTEAEKKTMVVLSKQVAGLYQKRGQLLAKADLILRQHAQQNERWEGNEERRSCYRCGRVFSRMTRRHHCRRCGRLCCAECSRYLGKKQDTSSNASLHGASPAVVVKTEFAAQFTATDSHELVEEYFDEHTYPPRGFNGSYNTSIVLGPSGTAETGMPSWSDSLAEPNVEEDVNDPARVLEEEERLHGSMSLGLGIDDTRHGRAWSHQWVRVCASCYQNCLRARRSNVLQRLRNANLCILDDGFFYYHVLHSDELCCISTALSKPESLKKQMELVSQVLMERSADYVVAAPAYSAQTIASAAQHTPQVLRTLGNMSAYAFRSAKQAANNYVGGYLSNRASGGVGTSSSPRSSGTSETHPGSVVSEAEEEEAEAEEVVGGNDGSTVVEDSDGTCHEEENDDKDTAAPLEEKSLSFL